jgi:hypothetical protein
MLLTTGFLGGKVAAALIGDLAEPGSDHPQVSRGAVPASSFTRVPVITRY